MNEKKIYISELEESITEPAVNTEETKPSRKKAAPKSKAKEEITYEAAVARLEEIVRKLEQSREEIGLEESMKLYEEGVSLVRRCYRELEAAEQKVKILQQTPNGDIVAVDFKTDEREV
ncbi:MAG: exodeoxyribonuclease VII small subunit [Ruminococcaceae bacterium]|nr:exodeoxyribonuclease VII small subunit [Oscillospiraceae bacterium]